MPDLLLNALTAGSAIAIAFLCLASRRPPNQRAIRWFGLFVLCVGFALLSHSAWLGGYTQAYPYLVPVCELTRFAMAPALYLSIWHFTHPQPMKAAHCRQHFMPALLFLGILLPSFIPDRSDVWAVPLISLPPAVDRALGQLVSYGLKLQLIVYWLLSWRLVDQHQRHIRQLAATIQHIQLRWLYGLLGTIAGMTILWLIQVSMSQNTLDQYMGYGYFGSLFLMSFFLIRQPEVFALDQTGRQAVQVLLAEQDAPAPSVKPVRLQPQEMTQLKERLDRLLTHDKVFMDADLDLAKLAKRLSISINDLSFLINEGYGINFFTLINQYRINEACRLMGSPAHRHLSILGIAYEVGFSAKTTFNTAFKKQVGQTPSNYLKTVKHQKDVPMYPSERPV
ncbi:AraC-like DNA-binding protein [Spirosoma oryzae]|uniref:AraC-like DNA-binding protein n=1 Tax=Spirosoma oryzae TaxID=1469603 RepID=A0A2T0TN00_9BACT|nr:AraC family transcriptional regulator [Spirosoma oryzae]PRY47017.1 AraC-like DNA-binding protein [Spirosoma oryzae]